MAVQTQVLYLLERPSNMSLHLLSELRPEFVARISLVFADNGHDKVFGELHDTVADIHPSIHAILVTLLLCLQKEDKVDPKLLVPGAKVEVQEDLLFQCLPRCC